MPRTGARPGAGDGDLGQRARPLVQPVGADGVGAQVHGEDVAAVRGGDDLVRVRALLPRPGRRAGGGDQVGAFAERPRGVDRVHGDRARAVVGAQQPAPARVHRQMTGVGPARRPAPQHLAVRDAHGGHGAALALLDGVQRPAVRVDREVRRVRDAGDRPGPGDPAGRGVVRGDADAAAAARRGGVGAQVERLGAGRCRRDAGRGGGPGRRGAAARRALRCRGGRPDAVPAARQGRRRGGRTERPERPDETTPAPGRPRPFRPTAHVPHPGSSSAAVVTATLARADHGRKAGRRPPPAGRRPTASSTTGRTGGEDRGRPAGRSARTAVLTWDGASPAAGPTAAGRGPAAAGGRARAAGTARAAAGPAPGWRGPAPPGDGASGVRCRVRRSCG